MLLLEEPGQAREGMLLALRIQLGRAAVVERRELPAGLDAAGRSAAARATLAAQGARAVVWTEPAAAHAGENEALTVFTLRHGPAGAPSEPEAHLVEGPDGPDRDRTIALKVSEIVEQRPATSTPSRAAVPPPPGTAPPLALTDRPAPEPAASWRVGLFAQASVMGAPVGGVGFSRWGLALGAGASLERGALRLGALAELGWLPQATSEDAQARRLQVQELAPGVRFIAHARLGLLWVGAYAGLSYSLLEAEGSARGMTEEETEVSLSGLGGASLELPLASALALGLDAGVQVRVRRQYFDVEDRELADSGRLRPVARLVVAWRP